MLTWIGKTYGKVLRKRIKHKSSLQPRLALIVILQDNRSDQIHFTYWQLVLLLVCHRLRVWLCMKQMWIHHIERRYCLNNWNKLRSTTDGYSNPRSMFNTLKPEQTARCRWACATFVHFRSFYHTDDRKRKLIEMSPRHFHDSPEGNLSAFLIPLNLKEIFTDSATNI